jgi:putative transcriptional regulator
MSKQDFLEGQLLIAMPSMSDPRFERSLIFICAHSDEGAMGLVVNKPAPDIEFEELLSRLNIPSDENPIDVDLSGIERTVLFGGPVEPGRGFVLHSGDYNASDNTLAINDEVGLTATLDVLHEIVAGKGPKQSVLALGYAGWSPGQLENEILHNGWLHCPADAELLFGQDLEAKYTTALAKLGVDPAMLSADIGRA